MKHIVKKIWWENAANIVSSAKNIIWDVREWVSQSVVISAMRSEQFNTTDILREIWKDLMEIWASHFMQIKENIESKIRSIHSFHKTLITSQFSDILQISPLLSLVDEEFSRLRSEISSFLEYVKSENFNEQRLKDDYTIPKNISPWGKDFSIMGFWEVLSARIFSLALSLIQNNSTSECVDTESMVDNSQNVSWVFGVLQWKFTEKIMSIVQANKVAIIPGYVAWIPGGMEQSVWRWYSDATAAIVAVGMKGSIEDTQLHIQKSVKWFLSIDPKIAFPWTQPRLLENIDYITAREITGGAKAKLLHDQTLRKEVLASWLEVHLYDPFWNGSKSIISREGTPQKWVQFVGYKDIFQFSISSVNFWPRGVLKKVFAVMEKYAGVLVPWWSETEITFTIDASEINEKQLDAMVLDLKATLEIDDKYPSEFIKVSKKSLIFCIGQNISHQVWTLKNVAEVISNNGINIELVSQWALERAMIFSVDQNDAQVAVNELHKNLIW